MLRLPLERLYVAHGRALPRPDATITRSPRIVLGISGTNNMDLPVGDDLAVVTLRKREAVWIGAHSHNRPHHDLPKVFLTLDFRRDFTRFYLRRYDRANRSHHAGHHTAHAPSAVLRHLLAALEELAPEPSRNETARALVECVLREAYRDLCAERPQGKLSVAHCQAACAYVEEHLSEPITRDDVARHLNLHPNHLSRLFRANRGETLAGFLTRLRMERAARLLAEHALPIGEVAVRSGFRQTAYFCNVFRRHYGMTPSAYRVARAGRGRV